MVYDDLEVLLSDIRNYASKNSDATFYVDDKPANLQLGFMAELNDGTSSEWHISLMKFTKHYGKCSLTQAEKDDIEKFFILRGNQANGTSVDKTKLNKAEKLYIKAITQK